MNSLGLDPKITLTVYIVGGLAFITALVVMFVYNKRTNTRKAVEQAKGRPPVDMEEGIAIATEKKRD